MSTAEEEKTPEVSFANDVEEAVPAEGQEGIRQRVSLSATKKAWDIDGDGK